MDEVDVDGSLYKMSNFDTRDHDFLCFQSTLVSLNLEGDLSLLNRYL